MVSYLGYKVEGMGFDAHMTVLYLGECDDGQVGKVNEFLAAHRDVFAGASYVARRNFALFGPKNDVPVLTVTPGKDIWGIRKLAEASLWNGSEFLDWNPHITLSPKPAETVIISPMIRVTHFGLY